MFVHIMFVHIICLFTLYVCSHYMFVHIICLFTLYVCSHYMFVHIICLFTLYVCSHYMFVHIICLFTLYVCSHYMFVHIICLYGSNVLSLCNISQNLCSRKACTLVHAVCYLVWLGVMLLGMLVGWAGSTKVTRFSRAKN